MINWTGSKNNEKQDQIIETRPTTGACPQARTLQNRYRNTACKAAEKTNWVATQIDSISDFIEVEHFTHLSLHTRTTHAYMAKHDEW